MPRFDGTGPQGAGPLTGRGFGPCSGGLGRGRGYGGRFGFGYGYKVIPQKDKKQLLEDEAKEVEEYLGYLKEELKNL